MERQRLIWAMMTVLAVAGIGFGDSIPVNNHSFENESSYPHYATPTNWEKAGSPISGIAGATTAAESGNTTTAGTHVAYINMGSDGSVTSLAQNRTGYFYEEGKTYTLTVAMSVRGNASNNYDIPYKLSFDYATGNTEIASATGTLLYDDRGPLVDYSLSYTATAADVGKTIKIRITHMQTDEAYPQQLILDNVRLDVTPEPATMSLLGLGGMFTLLRRRK